MATTEKVTLVMCEGEHNKTWSYEILQEANGQHTVRCKWGRLGTNGQQKDFSFNSLYSAEDFARGKTAEKTAKGYHWVADEVLELLTVRAKILGTNYKCTDLNFVLPIGPNKYRIMEAEKLADPSLSPKVWCVILANGQAYHILASADECLLVTGFGRVPNHHELEVTSSSKIEDVQDKVVQKLLERIPPIVATLF